MLRIPETDAETGRKQDPTPLADQARSSDRRRLRRGSAAQLLDIYTTERSAHVQHAIQMSISLGEVICVLDPAKAHQRNQRMVAAGADPARALPPLPTSNLVDGVVHRGPDGEPEGLAGTLAPQFRIRRAGRTGRFDDVVGHGFTLLTAGHDPGHVLSGADLDFLTSLGHIVRLVRDTGDDANAAVAADIDGGYLRYLADAGAAAVIVRPDFYVYGAVADPADLPQVVADLRCDLTRAEVTT